MLYIPQEPKQVNGNGPGKLAQVVPRIVGGASPDAGDVSGVAGNEEGQRKPSKACVVS